jgi:hypothetical protein
MWVWRVLRFVAIVALIGFLVAAPVEAAEGVTKMKDGALEWLGTAGHSLGVFVNALLS